ncbi:unnamed protein product [Diamesa serratosioi]
MSNFHTILNAEEHSIADLPNHIMDKILKQLRGRDLISLLAVSTTFNNAIASSKMFMSQICLHSEQTELSVIQNSNRMYQHLSLDGQSGCSDDIIETTKFQWKTIKVQNMILSSKLRSFINSFSRTLETLEYINVFIDYKDYGEHNCHFPKLKTLIINGTDSDASFAFLALLRGVAASVHELKIPQNSFVYLFDEMLVNRLNLKNLHLLTPSLHRLLDARNSLLLYKDCLEELTVEMLNNDATEMIWNEMTSLKKVTLRAHCSKFKTSSSFTLVHNNSIKEIVIHNNNVPFQMYEEFVRATPELKILEIHHYKKDYQKQKTGSTYNGAEMRRGLRNKMYIKASKEGIVIK